MSSPGACATGKLTLVTSNYEGTGPANDPNPQQFGTAENISVSANGDYIAYDSEATNLVPNENDINFTPDVYVYNLLTNKNILVSAAAAGGGIGNAPSDDPVISSDGSTVAYDSLASNLDPNVSSLEQYENYQVYASTLDYTSDTVAGTVLVSVDHAGSSGGDGTSIAPSLSDNGQMVAFQSASDNLVNIPNGGSYNDVYVRDLATNATQLVSIADTGQTTGGNSSFAPQMSGDGDYVLFYSLASDLTTTPVETQTNVFERDLSTDTTQLVSVDFEGTAGANDKSTLANQTLTESAQQATGQISDNGQYVVFDSVATDLVPNFQQENGGSPFGTDVYMRNMATGATTLISHAVGTTTTGGTGISVDTDMTPSGQSVAFQSAFPGDPDNLVSSDTNGQTQLYFASFGTLPAATTEAATSVSSTGAKLNASVNPEGTATTYDFVYGTSSSLSSGTTTTSESAGSGTSAVSESVTLTGLTPSTTYYFEVQATNSAGTIGGTILSFKTAAAAATPPAATTDAATSITSTGATLERQREPGGNRHDLRLRLRHQLDPELGQHHDHLRLGGQRHERCVRNGSTHGPDSGHEVLLQGGSQQFRRHDRRGDSELHYPGCQRHAARGYDEGGRGDHLHRCHGERDRQSRGDRHDLQFCLRHQLDPELGRDHDHREIGG